MFLQTDLIFKWEVNPNDKASQNLKDHNKETKILQKYRKNDQVRIQQGNM